MTMPPNPSPNTPGKGDEALIAEAFDFDPCLESDFKTPLDAACDLIRRLADALETAKAPKGGECDRLTDEEAYQQWVASDPTNSRRRCRFAFFAGRKSASVPPPPVRGWSAPTDWVTQPVLDKIADTIASGFAHDAAPKTIAAIVVNDVLAALKGE